MIKSHIPEFVTFILNRLKHAKHRAYIVGGAVRDAFLKRAITDWDVATSATPGQIKTIFRDVRLFALKHGTVTLVNRGRHFEVSTFKGEKSRIDEDLGLRDFTIDAMAYDPESNEVLDLHGGKTDITGRLIRAVGDPKACFQADPLRLLRAVRLATELRFKIDPKTLNSLAHLAPMLRSVATERIREEMMKALATPKPSLGFNLMVRTGLLQCFLPELLEGYRKKQNSYHRYTILKHVMETVDNVKPTPILRLTALLHDIAKPRLRKKINKEWRFYGHEQASADLAREIMHRLKFSKDTTRKVTNLIAHHMIGYNSSWSDGAVRRLIRRVGTHNIMDLIVFRRADILAHGLENDELVLLDDLQVRITKQLKGPAPLDTRALAIDGHDIMETLGLSPGPKVGTILQDLMEKVTEHPELNDSKILLGLIKQI